MVTFGKKGSMHQASGMDIVILLIGVIIGVAVLWYFKDTVFVQNLLCPVAPPAA